jgi:rubrerythrin
MSQQLGIDEALDTAMNAELEAQAFYARAAAKVQDPKGRELLGRLSAFEKYHYEQLTKLAHSLEEHGHFVDYEPRRVEQFHPLVGGGETAGTVLDELSDVPAILSKAIENEQVAGERYRALAAGTDDPAGRDMFLKLVEEEQVHLRILEDEFFSLSNQGTWSWGGLYGE